MSEDAPVNTDAAGWPDREYGLFRGTEDADQIAWLGGG